MDQLVSAITFQEFPKLSRLSRECIVTEKIDGTNAQIIISDDGTQIGAGSRTQLITPENDNYGFARWVQSHAEVLKSFLGPGRHFGEWWGQGIQRKYGMKEKVFSLFNTTRWGNCELPQILRTVPVLNSGQFDTVMIEATLECLRENGSYAAPGFMNPEGIVVFHVPSNMMFKKTLDGDGHKGAK